MVDNVPHVNMGGGVPPQKLNKLYNLPEAQRGADEVQLSSDVMNVRGAEGVRMDKVMEVKRAIANGTYLTPDKLDSALDSAIDDATGRS